MLTNTIQLLNDFLEITDLSQEECFYENDFKYSINNDIGIDQSNEDFALAKKYLCIFHKNKIFHITILCVAEKKEDILYAISFGCKEMNTDESMIIVEYIHSLIIQFSSFINEYLYEGLKDYSRLNKIYLSAYIKLTQRIHHIDSLEKQFIIDDYLLDKEYCHYNSNLYLSIFLHEDGLLNYLFIFADEENNA